MASWAKHQGKDDRFTSHGGIHRHLTPPSSSSNSSSNAAPSPPKAFASPLSVHKRRQQRSPSPQRGRLPTPSALLQHQQRLARERRSQQTFEAHERRMAELGTAAQWARSARTALAVIGRARRRTLLQTALAAWWCTAAARGPWDALTGPAQPPMAAPAALGGGGGGGRAAPPR